MPGLFSSYRILLVSSLISFIACTGNNANNNDNIINVKLMPPNVITVPGDGKVTLQWDIIKEASDYNLYWSVNPDINSNKSKNKVQNFSCDAVEITICQFVHSELTNGTDYYFVIVSKNDIGKSRDSDTIRVRPNFPAAGAPTNISVQTGNKRITLQWNEVPKATSYNVYWNTQPGVDQLSNTIMVTDVHSPSVHTDLTNGKNYYYVITAMTFDQESPPSVEISASPRYPALTPPSSVQISVSESQATLAWPHDIDAESYRLYWNTDSVVDESSNSIDIAADLNSQGTILYKHTGLINDVTYFYRIGARNQGFSSPLSKIMAVTPKVIPPGAPAEISATPGQRQAIINWQKVDMAEKYSLYIVTADEYLQNILVHNPPFVHDDLSKKSYHYYVKAVRLNVESAPSAKVSLIPLVPPAPPEGIIAQAGDSQITLNWNNDEGVNGYHIYWSSSATGVVARENRMSNVTSGYTHLQLQNNSPYFYAVVAVNEDGESDFSKIISGTPKLALPSPPLVNNIISGDRQIELQWAQANRATSYTISWSVYPDGPPLDQITTNDLSIVATRLTSGLQYQFGLIATNVTGSSPETVVVAAPQGALKPAGVDLQISDVRIGNTGLLTGESSTLNFNVENYGNTASTDAPVNIYLSLDGTTKDYFIGNRVLPAFLPGQFEGIQTGVTVPSITPAGSYTLIVSIENTADADGSNNIDRSLAIIISDGIKPPGQAVLSDTLLGGTVNSDLYLIANGSYVVDSNWIIAQGVTLTIEAGVKIEFANNTQLTVNGSLRVVGSAVKPITMTSNSTTPFPGSWFGIVINDTSNAVLFDYLTIEWAKIAMNFTRQTGAFVQHCVIQNNIHGIETLNSDPQIVDGNRITNNTVGIYARNVLSAITPRINNNSILNNTDFDFQSTGSDAGGNKIDASNNWWGSETVSGIMSQISDHRDNTSAPTVIITPFLNSTGNPMTGNALLGDWNSGLLDVTALIAGQTYEVISNFTIPSLETLIVPPGVTFRVYGSDTIIKVDGLMNVQGTADMKATFTTEKPVQIPGTVYWGGIIVSTSGTIDMNHAIVEWAYQGLVDSGPGSLVQNSMLRFNTFGVRLGTGDSQIINGNLITQNSFGVIASGRVITAEVTGNSIFANSTYDFETQGADADNIGVNATNNWWGSIDIPTIMSQINDRTDGGSKAIVRFVPFLDASGGSPTTQNALVGEMALLDINALVNGETYELVGQFTVPIGETWIVPSGVTIRAYEGTNIIIQGALDVQGTALAPAKFTTSAPSPISRTSYWRGLEIQPGSGPNTINYATIEWALFGLYFNGGSGTVQHSTIQNNNIGIFSNYATPNINSGNLITSNLVGLDIRLGVDIAPITQNNIFGNLPTLNTATVTNLQTSGIDAGGRTILATDNYWGTNAATEIEDTILHSVDSAARPTIDFSLFSNTPF